VVFVHALSNRAAPATSYYALEVGKKMRQANLLLKARCSLVPDHIWPAKTALLAGLGNTVSAVHSDTPSSPEASPV